MWTIRSHGPRRRSGRRASRRCWLLASSTALSLALAGCGGEPAQRIVQPKLPAPVAESLAARADSVAERLEAGDGCGAQAEAAALQGEAIAVVNEGRVPPPLQEELLGAVNAVAAQIECAPPPPVEEDDDSGKDRGKGKKKGKKRD